MLIAKHQKNNFFMTSIRQNKIKISYYNIICMLLNQWLSFKRIYLQKKFFGTSPLSSSLEFSANIGNQIINLKECLESNNQTYFQPTNSFLTSTTIFNLNFSHSQQPYYRHLLPSTISI